MGQIISGVFNAYKHAMNFSNLFQFTEEGCLLLFSLGSSLYTFGFMILILGYCCFILGLCFIWLFVVPFILGYIIYLCCLMLALVGILGGLLVSICAWIFYFIYLMKDGNRSFKDKIIQKENLFKASIESANYHYFLSMCCYMLGYCCYIVGLCLFWLALIPYILGFLLLAVGIIAGIIFGLFGHVAVYRTYKDS